MVWSKLPGLWPGSTRIVRPVSGLAVGTDPAGTGDGVGVGVGVTAGPEPAPVLGTADGRGGAPAGAPVAVPQPSRPLSSSGAAASSRR